MKRVVIHQPDFLSHLGFFHRFLDADLYVALDHVQFVNGTSRSWTHRDRIKTPNGAQWLSLSVKKAPRDTPINEIELVDGDWRKANLDLIRENYRQSRFFDEIYPEIEALYALPCQKMAELNIASIRMLSRLLDVQLPEVFSSELRPEGRSNALLVDILKKVSATQYLSGVGAKDYFEPGPFEAAGIEVRWQNFQHPIYPQLHGPFEPYLSSIDVLFNCGREEARRVLRSVAASPVEV